MTDSGHRFFSNGVDIEVTTFPVAPLGCNCSVVMDKISQEAIVVDPGGEENRIIALLKEKGCKVKWIIHTHAHFDHVLGTHGVAEHCRASGENPAVALHNGDLFLYENVAEQCGWFGLKPRHAEENINHWLQDEEGLKFGNHSMNVLHTPGHTPGSCSFHLQEHGILFTGDTLFAGGIGRTDLPGGNYEEIMTSIKDRLLVLDEGTTVVPGHGDLTRIFEEKKMNPFL